MYERMASVLKGWAIERGQTATEIAGQLGLSVSAVSDVLQGRSRPKPETLTAILGALGRTDQELLDAMAAAGRA